LLFGGNPESFRGCQGWPTHVRQAGRLPYRKFFQSEESPDAVLEVHDKVVFVQFAEIDLGAMSFRAMQAPAWMGCESPK
jgi:hypothetical protein